MRTNTPHMFRGIVMPALVAALSLSVAAVGLAQERKAGDRITYSVGMSGGGSLSGQSMNSTLSLVLDSISADGSAHAKATLGAPRMESITFEATMSSAGEILPKVTDPGARPSIGMSKAQAMAVEGSAMAQLVSFNFHAFNALAAACAAHGTLHVGDHWTAAASGSPPIEFAYKVTSRENHLGRDTFAVAMTSTPNSAMAVTGQGYYDPSARMVVGVHSEMQAPGGGQSQITDIALQP